MLPALFFLQHLLDEILAAAAAEGGARQLAHFFDAGDSGARAGSNGSVADGSAVADDHGSPQRSEMKTTFNIKSVTRIFSMV